ncbi:MAG: hypothetical protein FD156_451 [Nitrospirae bacterium]|nr:MAG: hypothetical protein FD156_451 [Nitrospirota bacterium]
MRKNLLFVTYQDEDSEAGFGYAIDLATMMKKGLSVLLLNKKGLWQKFDNLMTAITFAEAGEHEIAREILSEDGSEKKGFRERIASFTERCSKSNVDVSIHTAETDVVSAVKDLLTQKMGIDMVLLSPSVTNNGHVSSKELNRLVKTASRPVVTMARNVYAT